MIRSRVEDFKPEESIDCLVTRAFAPLKKLLFLCSHLLARETRLIIMGTSQLKIPDISAESVNIVPLLAPGDVLSRQLLIIEGYHDS